MMPVHIRCSIRSSSDKAQGNFQGQSFSVFGALVPGPQDVQVHYVKCGICIQFSTVYSML
jgi:hypothetical protein